jgi:hypothetical protein
MAQGSTSRVQKSTDSQENIMGRKWTPEQRARQSKAIKAYWRKKKTPLTIWQRLLNFVVGAR